MSGQGFGNLNRIKHLLEADLRARGVCKPARLATLEEVRAHLGSKDLPTVAWGAHLAAENRLKDAAPDICRSLVRLGKRDCREIRFVGMALLDSLIRLGADVPQAALRPWADQRLLAPTILLAARNPRRHEKLLVDIMDSQEGESWLAAGNLLMSIRSKRIAPQLLKHLFVEVLIQVRETDDQWSAMSGMDTSCGFCAIDPTSFKVPMPYPPTGHYSLIDGKRHGIIELAVPGGQPIYYLRRIHASGRYKIWPPCQLDCLYYAELKLHWIAKLLGTRVEALPFRRCLKPNMVWRDAKTYVRKVRTEKIKALGTFRSLANCLASAGLCDKKALAGLAPTLLIEVTDFRSKKLAELPEMKGVKVHKRR